MVRSITVATYLLIGIVFSSIQASAADPALGRVQFEKDVMPLLTRYSCNSADCHDPLVGKGQLRLSPLGSDPRADFLALTELERYQNLTKDLDSSVLLTRVRNPVAEVLFETDSDEYKLLKRWVQQEHASKKTKKVGLVGVNSEVTQLKHLIIEPQEWVTPSHKSLQLRVTAAWSDGTQNDVTNTCRFSSTNKELTQVTETGKVESLATGIAGIEVRFLSHISTLPVYVQGQKADQDWNWQPPTTIDKHALKFWKKIGVQPVEQVADSKFLKRVFVQVLGSHPDLDLATQFSESTDVNKRTKVIDELLSRPEHAEYWADVWTTWLLEERRVKYGDWLIAEQKLEDKNNRQRLRDWLREQFAKGTSLDDLAAQLLTATGSTKEQPETVFLVAHKNVDGMTRAFGRAFLGANLRCARCHDQPHYDWDINDFYGIAACFKDIEVKSAKTDSRVSFKQRTEFINPRNQTPIQPTVFQSENRTKKTQDARQVLADWLQTNEQGKFMFARHMANRYWELFFARPLVESSDDLRPNSVERIPGVLDELAQGLVKHDFDPKYLIRSICASGIYQLDSVNTDRDDWYGTDFTKMRIAPAVALRVIQSVTKSDLGKLERKRPVPAPFEESDVNCSRNDYRAWTPPTPLYMLDSGPLEAVVKDPNGRAANLIQSTRTIDEITEELFLAILLRKPSAKEAAQVKKHAAKRKRSEFVHDIFWALLNTREFVIIE